MRVFILFLAIAGFVLACSDFDKFYEDKKTEKDSGASSDATEIVAEVGSEKITKEELIKSLRNLPPKQMVLYISSPEKLNEYLQSYADQLLLTQEAERVGIDDREDIKQNLEAYKRRLLIQALGKEIESRKISEEDIQRYYEENSNNLQQIRLSIIFIRIDPQNAVSKDEAIKKAESIVKKARAGSNFEVLVDKYSDDPLSKGQKGDTGYIQKGRLPLEIESKIFNLREGEVSDPIEAPNGLYIAKVTEGLKVLPLEQAKGTIEVELKKNMFNDYVKSLREKTKVEIFQNKLKEINLNDKSR